MINKCRLLVPPPTGLGDTIRKIHYAWLGIAIVGALLFAACGSLSDLAGGSSSETVIGKIAYADGTPAGNTTVTLLRSDYNPLATSQQTAIYSSTTDENGEYVLQIPGSTTGIYSIQAVHSSQRSRLLIIGIEILGDSTFVPEGKLTAPGTIKVKPADPFNGVNGYFFIAGTTIFSHLSDNTGSVILDSVPAGTIPLVCYGNTGSISTLVIRHEVRVVSDDTATIANVSWSYKRDVNLNTAASGANVSGTIYDFPVLIRLNSNNFDFSQALRNGEDLRFIKEDGTALPYEFERWDPIKGFAELWVRVDTIFGKNSTQVIPMYWGNPDAASASNGAMVFDTATGFQGVWHLSEPGDADARDATSNRFDGVSYNMTSASAVSGAIGTARQFDGLSTYINMLNTSDSRLNFPQSGTYSVSAWVYTDTLSGKYQNIASKGDFQYNLQLMDQGKWEFTEFHDTTGWFQSVAPAKAKVWTHVVGMRSGDKQYLYVNGTCVDDSIYLNAIKPTLTTRYRVTTNNFMIGKRVDFAEYYFDGVIDEVRVSSRELSPDWIRLCYMNQRKDDKLVVFK